MKRIVFIGSAGIPNRYGGFESFLENCAPKIVSKGYEVVVTCDAGLYSDKTINYRGVRRVFLSIPANGGWSVIHDLIAFMNTFRGASHIVILGVSGGIWFPIFRILCDLSGARLFVNVDGIEWRRTKFGKTKRLLLKAFDLLAQKFAHTVIYDNPGLLSYLTECAKLKAACIAYSGDHVLRLNEVKSLDGIGLTICRIEPENNLEMLIQGALMSKLRHYIVVGNWNHSSYSQNLRRRYENDERLLLLDQIYDSDRLAQLRESCGVYIHGHSVGGTNPSLVEMLFYDCQILCFDVIFNRYTAGNSASYFNSIDALANLINNNEVDLCARHLSRKRYASSSIVDQYLKLMQ